MAANTNVLNQEALPAHVGGERYTSNRSFVAEKPEDEQNDILPEICDANEIDWTRAPMPSQYSKYDNLPVGKGIKGLLPGTARTISARLKRLGMNITMRKTANGTYAIARQPDLVGGNNKIPA